MTQHSHAWPRFQPRRADCEVRFCREPAVLRKVFVDIEGFWTWLCKPHFNKVVGWHD